MSNSIPIVKKWVSHRLNPDVQRSLNRMSQAPDVQYLAIMPDVHLATDVCIGTVLATKSIVYPAAVGGDIGCGILAIELLVDHHRFADERAAVELLAELYRVIPRNRHQTETMPTQIDNELLDWKLSDARLEKMKHRDARVQLGTLGRGNHFLEFQSDVDGKLWLMIHSGSRSMGQWITAHHLAIASGEPKRKLIGLDSTNPSGQAYLKDMQWARKYAELNRLAMMNATLEMLFLNWGIEPNRHSLVHTDHNHVARETHFGNEWLVHRKGAQRLDVDQRGIVPGSMGTCSFLVAGRGCPESLNSCSHGAGRQLSRTEARRRVSMRRFVSQMKQVRFDQRNANRLRDEAPEAYKDVREVMRCQRELVRVVAEHVPVLSFKGR